MDSLGDRMKGYEEVSQISLTKRMPFIIRIDGKAFHTFTKGFNKPWDANLQHAMFLTAFELCENISGAKLAYVQSDEISILVTDYDKLNTEPWFGKNVQKIVSVSASIATGIFNSVLSSNKVAFFDSRVFVLPKEEVCNYFIWRQQDASRNSVQMLGRAHFSHKELQKKNNSQIQDMLMLQRKINWNDLPVNLKRGTCILKDFEGKWQVDNEIPIFTQARWYIDGLEGLFGYEK